MTNDLKSLEETADLLKKATAAEVEIDTTGGYPGNERYPYPFIVTFETSRAAVNAANKLNDLFPNVPHKSANNGGFALILGRNRIAVTALMGHRLNFEKLERLPPLSEIQLPKPGRESTLKSR